MWEEGGREGGREGGLTFTHGYYLFICDRIYVPEKTLEHMASHPEVSGFIYFN